nr:hypothetical protein Iba_chr01eCG8520 [Ipomoea batatas]
MNMDMGLHCHSQYHKTSGHLHGIRYIVPSKCNGRKNLPWSNWVPTLFYHQLLSDEGKPYGNRKGKGETGERPQNLLSLRRMEKGKGKAWVKCWGDHGKEVANGNKAGTDDSRGGVDTGGYQGMSVKDMNLYKEL